MKDIAYYNGKIGRIDEVQAPITDRGFYFGDGVYDAAMVNNKKIFELEDHLDRFYNMWLERFAGLYEKSVTAP